MSPDKSTPEGRAREKIDRQLQQKGWEKLGEYIDHDDLNNLDGTGYIEELGTETGPADYGLIIDGDLVSVIEAKKETESAAGHFQQAERYSKSVDSPYSPDENYGLSVAFVSNGDDMYLYDFRELAPTSRPIITIYEPDGLKRLITRDYQRAHSWLQENEPEEFDPDLWDHQIDCIENVEESLRDRERKMLVKMATGSGKTRTAQAITYRLLESGFADSILFIPDTRKLAKDGYTAFTGYDPTGAQNAFSEKYRIENLQEDEPSRLERGEVVITTLQKMYHLLDDDEVEFSVGDFDVIISDECHRSVYEMEEGYGRVFRQFDAIEIGLTATPTDRTLSRFDGNLVAEYGYRQALNDEHVVPFQIYALETEVTMGGVFDSQTNDYYSPDKLGSEILVPDTHRKVGQEIRDRMEDENELTLIFARNDDHATQIVSDLRETVFSDKPDAYIQKITYKADRPEDTLSRFEDPYDPSPVIAVTVQMVSTGVDIRPLKNVVLLNPVKSPVRFNQMLGRGTRTYDDKEFFRIFDCVGALDYFEGTPPFATEEYDSGSGGGETSGDSDVSEDDGPKIVDVPDEIIRSEPVFPTESGERLTAQAFRDAFRQDVRSEADEIIRLLNNSRDIESATESVQPILEDMSQYYVQIFLEKAYQSVLRGEDRLLIDYVNEALTGRLPEFDERVAHSRSVIEEKYDLTDIEKQYLELITAVAEPLNGISKSDFFDPPLSEIGGWKRANEEFDTIVPKEMISEFRYHLCDIIGDVDEDDDAPADKGDEGSINSTS
jgi:type I restriction enzyme R subunit